MLGIVLLSLLASSGVLGADVHILVQPTGSDSNDGITHPVKTIEKAVARLNDADVKGHNVFIEVRKGTYDLSRTITFPRDFAHSITLRSFYNKESAYITGGKRLSSHLFRPVTDHNVLSQLPSAAHSKVRQLRFSDVGISVSQLGRLERYGFGHSRTAPMEISFNGKALRLARWPNDGSYLNVESTPDGQKGKRFTYPSSVGSRAEKWRQENDLWVYGFWYWSWADDSASIASVDPAHRTMTLGSDLHYGMRTGHIQLGNHAGYSQQGGYFNVFNALSELDQGGEYYIDRKAGILYLWPPTKTGAMSDHDVIVGSMIDTMFSLSHVSNIHFQDLSLESSRHLAISGDSITSCSFQRLEIKNTGAGAIHIGGAKNVVIKQCDIHDTDGGISVSGGDRRTLTSSGCVIENNHIWDFSRAAAISSHGISLGGVGTHVQYNEINGGSYTGIWWGGNDHVISRNHLHHVCAGSSDCGAMEADRDWTFRGNVIRQNHIHNVLRFYPGAEVRGIMLDDQYSSALIEGNVFHDNEVHFNIGGGRDNIARYNVFHNARSCAVDMDARGASGGSNDKTLHDRLKSVPYSTGVWAQKYPSLARIDHEQPGAPRGNQVYKNVFYHGLSRRNFAYHGAIAKSEYFNMHDNNENTHIPDFNNPGVGDYRVVCSAGSWAAREHFPQPPTQAEVGPHLPVGPAFKHGQMSFSTRISFIAR